MINEKIKMIVDGFLNAAKLPAILIGTYNGAGVQVDSGFVIPSAQLSGNMKTAMKSWGQSSNACVNWVEEFYVLEIIGKNVALKDEIKGEAIK